jgi:hypothetical protein
MLFQIECGVILSVALLVPAFPALSASVARAVPGVRKVRG